MTLNSNFPARLKELMGDESYAETGRKLGVSKSTISAYINGTRVPKRPFLLMVANTYGVSPVWLCGYDAPKYVNELDAATTEDKELDDLLEMYRTRDDCRILFSLAKNATPDDVKLAASILEKLHDKEGR